VQGSAGTSVSLAAPSLGTTTTRGGGIIVPQCTRHSLSSYYATDHLGTVRFTKTVDDTGAVTTTTHDYEPFGVEITPTDECGNTHRFTGHERDAETGNDYMHFRFFSSNMGRFQKPDSVFGSPLNPQGWNLYSYVQGNPVNFNDPTGHAPKGGDPDPTTPEEIRKQEMTDLLGGPLGEHSFVEMSGRPDPGSDYFVYKYTSTSTGMSFTSFAKLTSDLVISIFKVAREVYLLTTGTDRVNGGIEAAGMVIWNPRTGEIRGMAMRSPMAKMSTDERLRLYGDRWRNKFDFNSSEWWAAVHALFGGGNPEEWISLAIFHGHRDSETATASFDDTHGSREFLNKRLGISAPLLYGAVSRDGISWYHEGLEGFSDWPNWLQGW
jgi:RHS repeat-associated protein